MRKVNGLYPLFSKNQKINDYYGFDVETITDKNIFYIGGLYNDDGFECFDDKDEMIKVLLSKRFHNKVIVATNLGFDFNALFFDSQFWSKFKTIFVGSQMIGAVYEPHDKLKITFIDTFNYCPFSVSLMGKILGINKLPSPKCLSRIPKNNEERKELVDYNKRDCEITFKFMKFLQEGFNILGADAKITVASTSLNGWRRNYLRFPMIQESHVTKIKDINNLIYASYYGGRTEAFSRGKIPNGNYKMYDLNSLYPSCMRNEYPLPQSVRYVKKGSKRVFDYEGVSDVRFTAPSTIYYPFLPVRTKEKLMFPLGTHRGVYTHVELRKAIELGYTIEAIFQSVIYKKTWFPFREYVNVLYDKRLEYKKQNNPMELVTKLMMNSLYGKFAEKNHTEVQFIDTRIMNEKEFDEFMFDEDKNIVMGNESKGFELKKKRATSAHIFPILSSYTTAYGRIELYEYLSKYNGVYCDTDSIVTEKSIPESKLLGKMKVEYDILNGVIVKPKMYMFETPKGFIIKMKGIPRASIEKFELIMRGEKVHYEKFSKTKESMRGGYRPNTILQVSKKIDLEDTKRMWEIPFNASQWQKSNPKVLV